MSSPTTDPTLSVIVQLPSDLARTIDVLAKERGQDRDEFIVGVQVLSWRQLDVCCGADSRCRLGI
jgi:hypothetical protein